MQRMIESPLQISGETTLEGLITSQSKTKVVSLLETVTREATEGEETPVYQIVEIFVHRAVAWGAVNDFIHLKVDNFV